MGTINLKKGLDLPIVGTPNQVIDAGKSVKTVALLGDDYVGMRPTMMVQVGDKVALGQIVFTDKKMTGVNYTSPGAGTVVSVNRGAKRKFLSIVIRLEGDDEKTFASYSESELDSANPQDVKKQLVESGQWTLLRARPFGKVADPETTPHSIFITAMDTNPLAPSVEKILEGRDKDFAAGLKVLSKLTEGTLYVNKAPDSKIPVGENDRVTVTEFSGPHPAGLPGTHIHFLDPVGRRKTVWYINAQDVAAIGSLFLTGKIDVERIVSLAGPSVKNPRLVKTRVGANLYDLTEGELTDGENRIVSGSVLSGRTADEVVGFLGRFHQQVSVLPEGRERKFLGWLAPGADMFSVKKVLVSALSKSKKFRFDTSTHGGERAIVPIGSYEKVMPLDILPTFLLRALAVDDVDEAEKLGCLELDEEDLALCTFVCPSKIDHGAALRRNLTIIEKEG